MTLRRCDAWWGGVTLYPGQPAVEQHNNVVYLPWGKTVPHFDNPDWGIFGQDGELIEAATFRRGLDRSLVGQRHDLPEVFAAAEPAPEGAYIYGGSAFSHYGHFTCATLSRLWFIGAGHVRGLKVLFHSHESVDELFSYPHVERVFSVLGLPPEDVVVLNEPARIGQLFIPLPAFEEQSFVFEDFRNLGLYIGDRLGGAIVQSGRPAYLTKLNLASGVHRFEGEDIIVNVLRSRGVEIISPEQLPLSEQIALFASGRPVLGPASSAFHTVLFSRGVGKTVCLCPKREVNSNFALIDAVVKQKAEYLYSDSSTENYGADPLFHNVIRTEDNLEQIALDLLYAACDGVA